MTCPFVTGSPNSIKQFADLIVENRYETRLDCFIDNYLEDNEL